MAPPPRSQSVMRQPSSRTVSFQQQQQQHRRRTVSALRPRSDHPEEKTSFRDEQKQQHRRQDNASFRSVSRNSRQSQESGSSQEENRYRRRGSQKQLTPESSPEEQRAKKYIHDAESRIDGLLQELEDLRFLEELDQQDPPVPTAAAAAPPVVPQKTLGARSQSVPKPRTVEQLKTPRGDTIPAVIRAASPPGRNRLPPPQRSQSQQRPPMRQQQQQRSTAPKSTTTTTTPAAAPLPTPRVISKMDRMSLELETQTLARRVEMLQQEKNTLQSEVNMYKVALEDNDHQAHTTAQLQNDLGIVRKQLQQAKQDLVASRDKVCADYERQLQERHDQVERTRHQAQQYQQERDALQHDLERIQAQVKDSKVRTKEEAAQARSKHTAKQKELEGQLQQVADLADDLRQQLEKEQATVKELATKLVKETKRRDDELRDLRNELEQQKNDNRHLEDDHQQQRTATEKVLNQLQNDLQRSTTATQQKDDAHSVQLASVNEELRLLRDAAERRERDLTTQLEHCQDQLRSCELQCTEQSTLVEQMSQRLDTVHSDYRTKFSELKDAYDTKEKRRLQELVDQHAVEKDEHERRLKALQQQLSHQTDRHHAELGRNVSSALQEQQATYERKLQTLQDELEDTQQKLQRADTQSQELRDAVAAAESATLAVRNDMERTHTQLQAQHAADLRQREESTTERLRTLLSAQNKLTHELERKDAELTSVRSRMSQQMQELKEDGKKELDSVVDKAKGVETLLRQQILVLEGKVESGTTAVEEKEQVVDQLRRQLASTTQRQEEYIEELRDELKRTNTDMDSLLSSMNEKLQREMRSGEQKADSVTQLEQQVEELSRERETDREQVKNLQVNLEKSMRVIEEKTKQIAELELQLVDTTRREEVSRDRLAKAEAKLEREFNAGEVKEALVAKLERDLEDARQQEILRNERVTSLEARIEQEKRTVEEKTDEAMELERKVEEMTRKDGMNKERAQSLETEIRQARSDLISEKTRHESAEEQTRVDLAVLQGKLKANEASLVEKRETIDELEDKLRMIADESSSATKELQRELDRLREETKEVKILLDKERTESFTKDGILKQQQKKLRENHTIIISLEERVMKYSEDEQNGSRAIKELRAALDQAKIEVSSIRLKSRGVESRLQEQLSIADEKLQASEADSNQRALALEQLKVRISELEEDSSAHVKTIQSRLSLLEKQLEDSCLELEEEKRAVALKSKEVERLKLSLDEMEQLKATLRASEKATQDAEKQLAESKSLLESQKRAIEAGHNEKEAAFSCEIKACKAAVEQKESELKDLRQEIEAERTQMKLTQRKTEEEISSLTKKVSAAESLIQQQDDASSSKTEVMEKLEAEIVAMRKKASESSDANREIEVLRTKLTQATQEIESYKAEISRLQEIQSEFPADELNEQLRVEQRTKSDLMGVVARLESDIASKTVELSKIPALQRQVEEMGEERQNLEQQISRLSAELSQKDTEGTRGRVLEANSLADELTKVKSDLDSMKERNEELEKEIQAKANRFDRQEAELGAKLMTAESRLASHKVQLAAVTEQVSSDAERKMDDLAKLNKSLQRKVRELEEDSDDRESQMKRSAEKFSNQILELQMKVEELSQSKSSLKARLAETQANLDQKEELISVTSTQLSGDISDLQSRLGEQLAENETMKRTVKELQSKVTEAGDLVDIEARLEAEAKEKRSLRSKVGDVEQELQRKEKQVKDVVDRYSRELTDLERKLEEETRSKMSLEKEMMSLRSEDDNASQASGMKTIKEQLEKALMEQRRANERLQAEVRNLKENTSAPGQPDADLKPRLTAMIEENRRLHTQLSLLENSSSGVVDVDLLNSRVSKLETSKRELEHRLKKSNSERTEVITALEDVISEVQSREEEIETLAQVLKKRDEELDHAKLIASKALASAQEMKARYRGKGGDTAKRQAELQAEVEFLSEQNSELEKKATSMKRDLAAKERECDDLRGKLQSPETKSSKLDTHLARGKDDFQGFDDVGFPTFDTGSPTQPDTVAFNDTLSTQSGDLQRSNGWIHDFDSSSTVSVGSSHDGVRTEPDLHSRRSLERDALRKYVRKRYMKTKGST